MKNTVYGCGVLLVVWGGGLAALLALWKINQGVVIGLVILAAVAFWVKLVDAFFTVDVRVRKGKRNGRRR